MAARERVAGGGDFGVTCRFDELGTDPWPISAYGELYCSVEQIRAVVGREAAVSPFLAHAQVDQKGEERKDVDRDFADGVEEFIKNAAGRETQVLQKQKVL